MRPSESYGKGELPKQKEAHYFRMLGLYRIGIDLSYRQLYGELSSERTIHRSTSNSGPNRYCFFIFMDGKKERDVK